jgi:hypothetical protein
MGTIPLVENLRLTCSDGSVVLVEAITTTGNMMMGEDGSAGVYVDVVDGFETGLSISLSRFSETWLARFCDALVANPGFRKSLVDVADADGLVIPAAPARDDGRLSGLIRKGTKARFKDYVGVRSGRDRYSAMKLGDLRSLAGERACADLDARMEHVEEAHRVSEGAKVLRWFLRGMPMAMAARKVEVDREVTANVIGRGQRR